MPDPGNEVHERRFAAQLSEAGTKLSSVVRRVENNLEHALFQSGRMDGTEALLKLRRPRETDGVLQVLCPQGREKLKCGTIEASCPFAKRLQIGEVRWLGDRKQLLAPDLQVELLNEVHVVETFMNARIRARRFR